MTSFAFWEPILIITMINAMLALGFYVTMSSGILSVAHAAAAGMGAYAAAVLTTNFHLRVSTVFDGLPDTQIEGPGETHG